MQEYGIFFDLGKTYQVSQVWYINPLWKKISVMVEDTGIWYTIGLWLEKSLKVEYTECGKFDHGKVEYTRMWYILHIQYTLTLYDLNLR